MDNRKPTIGPAIESGIFVRKACRRDTPASSSDCSRSAQAANARTASAAVPASRVAPSRTSPLHDPSPSHPHAGKTTGRPRRSASQYGGGGAPTPADPHHHPVSSVHTNAEYRSADTPTPDHPGQQCGDDETGQPQWPHPPHSIVWAAVFVRPDFRERLF